MGVGQLLVIFVIVLVVIVLASGAGATHNSIVRRRNLVTESWRQVDVELRRRYDLIPNLVQVVEAYAQYERSVLESLTAARETAMATQQLTQRADAEDQLGQAVRGVLIRAEQYPQLGASAQFLALQNELVNTEDRIAAGRRLYNGNVRALNNALQTFPSSIMGKMMNVEPAVYFTAAERAMR